MKKSHPAVKLLSSALAVTLTLGPTPLWAQNMVSRAGVPTVAVVPGAAAAAALAAPSARIGLTPSLSIPGSALPSPTISGLSIVPSAAALTASAIPTAAAQAPLAVASALSIQPAAAPVGTPAALAGAPVAAPYNSASAAQAAPAAKAGPVARVFQAIRESLRLGSTETLFTGGRTRGTGFVPEAAGSQESEGVRLDPIPAQPRNTETPGVSWDKVQMPGIAARPNILARVFGAKAAGLVTLPGNPSDAAGVEAALRRLIQSNPGEYGGIAPAQLATVIAHKVPGQSGLADTIYVNFKQLHNGVVVDGTYLGFTVKIFNGQAVVIGSSAHLYPWLQIDTFGRFDDRAIIERAAKRLGHTTSSADDFRDQGVRIMHLSGQWRAVRLMMSKAKTLMAAVDINTGETFAWDARNRMAAQGKAEGRGIADGPIESGVPSPLALGHVEIVASNGKKYFADAEGRFTVEGAGDAPVQLTVRLSGKYAVVEDQEHKDLVVTVTAKPGEELRVVFNPEGKDENALAQVNAYVHTTTVHEFLMKNGVALAALDKPMPIKTNIDDECNAYYTPYSPSLNFFKSSSRCANSSYNDVNMHEYGHGLDDAAHHGIPNGGLSEGIGDMLAMILTNQPIIGRGFIKGGSPDYIRTGENKYQYRSRDEVHDQGQAGGGFVWKLRKAFMAALGEAQGAALTTALVLPAVLASNRDIPAFINSVLLRDINAEGVAPHYKEIAAAAAAHGIKVKEPKPGQVGPSGGYVESESWYSGLWANIMSSWAQPAP